MTIVSILVDGKAIGQGSFRPGRKLRQSPELVAYRQKIRWLYAAASSHQKASAGVPITVVIEHRRQRPLDHWRRDGTLTLKGARTPEPTSRHLDVDKLCRGVLDALTGAAYADDSQVSHLHVHRYWTVRKGDREQVQIVVSWDDA